MNSLKQIFYLTILFYIITISHATAQQETQILVKNSNTKSSPYISVKWYSPKLIYPTGVNIYRKAANQKEWEKINTVPIRKKNNVTPAELAQDSTLSFFVDLFNGNSTQTTNEGLVFLNSLVKTFESTALSHFLGIQYDDKAVKIGERYRYKIVEANEGNEKLIGYSQIIVAGKKATLLPPKEIKIDAKRKKVHFKWLPEESRFYGVNIYRKADSTTHYKKLNNNPLMISLVPDSNGLKNFKYPKVMYRDDSVNEKVGYTYYLTAVDFFGEESEKSELIKVFIKDETPPTPPQNLSFDNVDHKKMSIKLKWENVEDNEIIGINIFRSAKSDGSFKQVNTQMLPALANFYDDQVNEPGPMYYYVASIDEAGNQGKSNMIFVEVKDVFPPSQPQGVTIKADPGKFTLSWKPNPEPDVMGYLIYRTINKNDKENFVLLKADPVTDTIFSQRISKNAKNKFLYKIIAIDTAYNKSIPSEVATSKLPDVTPPTKPFIKQIINQDNQITLEWLPNPESDLKGYYIYRSDERDSANFVPVNQDHITITTYIDKNIVTQITYYYYLQAIDSAGNRSKKSDVYAGTNAKKVQQENTFKKVKAKYSKARNEVTLSWQLPDTENIKGFIVYKKTEKSRLKPITGLIQATQLIDKNIKKSTTYYYQVRAYTTLGQPIKSDMQLVTLKK